jgi:hypothetical protein
MGILTSCSKSKLQTPVSRRKHLNRQRSKPLAPKVQKVDLAEFTAKERKLMDDALTFMANLAATGGIANGAQITTDCVKVSSTLSKIPADIEKDQYFLTAGDFAKVGFSLSSYHKAIPQLVEVNPQYRVHKEELLQDYSLHMPDLIRRMTELL